MPTNEQLTMLMKQRGSLTVPEIRRYFKLNGAWVRPLNDILNGLVLSGEVYRDRTSGSYLLEVSRS